MAKSSSFGGIIIALVVVGGIAGAGYYYFQKSNQKDPEYSTVKATRQQVIQSITASGNLQTRRTVDIGAQVSGQVLEVNADFNDVVKKGDVLVTIDPTTYQQKLTQARASLASTEASWTTTKRDLENAQELYSHNLIAKKDLEDAEAKLKQSDSSLISQKAAVTDAETNLSHTIVTAPTDAIVLNRMTDPGKTVNATNSVPNLFTLVDTLDLLQIDAGVSEADIGQVVEGQPVTFTVDAFPGQTFNATVKQVRNSAKNNNGVVTYSALIDVDNSSRRLRPGMTANVSIIIASRASTTLVVPNNTLRVRIPEEVASSVTKATASAAGAAATTKQMTPEETAAAEQDVLTQSGLSSGQPITPDAVEKAKQLAKDKGLADTSFIDRAARGLAGNGARGQRGQGGPGGGQGGRGGGGGGGGGRGGRTGGPNVNAGGGLNVSAAPRTIYRLVDENEKKHPESLQVTLGISDGQYTEVLDSGGILQPGDTLISYIAMPGAQTQVRTAPGAPTTGAFGVQQARGGAAGGRGGGF